VSRVGGFARAYVPASHPIHAFREAVRLGAQAAGVPLAAGPVEVSILAVFARPGSHRLASGELRRTAPRFPGHRCGDADNLAKGILDALHGVAFEDDDQVDLGFVRRRYGPRSFVEIWLAEFEAHDLAEGAECCNGAEIDDLRRRKSPASSNCGTTEPLFRSSAPKWI
jgi:Holliday junction resolvase RusA-like endonuclease